MIEVKQLANTFDLSILRPDSISQEEIEKTCAIAIKHGIRSIVVHPCNVKLVKTLLSGSSVLTVSVCDFPHGKSLTKSRVKDVKEILKEGADEIDIVANYQYLVDQDIRNFKKDIKAVVKAMEGKTLKVILEVDMLNEKLIKTATQIICKVSDEESDRNVKLIIKTKTGFSENKVSNMDALRIIKKTLDELGKYGEDKIQIKASGGVGTKEEATNLLGAGAHILGVGKKGFEILGVSST